ncbi:ABC transporter substrate-binding protein [Deinococcus aestuarii]|uniref:ABC transporter substrate-binding protein n=1 Tax=Deinococcus aestuarii TaxID=2774531 RepID=UPI001C0CB503|nr:sugar ABC transporter substrate-binding protein [Deinococcus aestuarii]
MRKARSLLILAALASGSALAQEKVTLRFTTWAGGDALKLLQSLAADYGKRNRNVTVEVESIPFGSYDQKITVQIAGGTPPDVGWVAERSVPGYIASRSLVNLRPTVASDASLVLNDYSPASLALWTRGDALYGLPFSFSPMLVYYNRDLFEKAGIPTPATLLRQNKWNYAAFEASASAIKKASPGAYGASLFRLDPQNWAGGILAAVYSNGGDVFGQDAASCALDSAGSVRAFELAQRMMRDGTAPRLGEQVTFASGRLGMYADQVSYSAQLKDVDFKWDVAPMPSGPSGRKTLLGQAGYAVFSASKHPREAQDFIKYLSSRAVMQRTAQFFPPPRRSLLNSSTFLKNPLISEASLRDAVLKQVGSARTLIVPTNWTQVNDVVVRNLERTLRPSANVGQELGRVCNEVDAVLKK